MEENRIWAIKNNRQVIFNIKETPNLSSDTPIYRNHESGYFAVKKYDEIIRQEAQRFGVDADLVRAIMYIVNADGHRGGFDELVQRLGIQKTSLPMNINPMLWDGIAGVSKDEFVDPEKNIRASVALIKEIQRRVAIPTAAKVGSLWQYSGSEVVRPIGVRIERAMREKLWEIQPKEGMPGPHVP